MYLKMASFRLAIEWLRDGALQLYIENLFQRNYILECGGGVINKRRVFVNVNVGGK